MNTRFFDRASLIFFTTSKGEKESNDVLKNNKKTEKKRNELSEFS